ncbi:hypothetical protein DFR70_103139 [Nocardia tenerifensis]|uniref:DUF8176 domain-containing protein n=1 Tax=Nocardia tenerifensis TaxID=228006 RepID=A0A318K3J6_9NOCA|nr:hypothetical protein [Nocardia tenerifensis]PXX66391.1 hypothetical protein DFR70_103139 [Nocardia tenerifensis]
MTSEGDPREKESDDQSASDFGPPVGEFGPPVSEFGPPISEFGPPVAEFGPPTGNTGPRWQVPEQTGDHPELVWRPAADSGTTSPPIPQYRAPDSSSTPDPRPATPPVPPRIPPDRLEAARSSGDADKDSWWTRPTDTGSVPKPPPLTSPSLSWADDPIAQRLAPSTPAATPTPPRRSGSHTGRNVLAGILAVVILVGLTVTVILVSRNTGDDNASPPAAATSTAQNCPTTKSGKVTIGNGNGDTASGPGAILGFQYAFYVERSGERARKFVADDTFNVSTAEIIQKGIDEEVPRGTTHCLRISEMSPGTYAVDLREFRPDGTERLYPQIITTVVRDGKNLLYSIEKRE